MSRPAQISKSHGLRERPAKPSKDVDDCKVIKFDFVVATNSRAKA